MIISAVSSVPTSAVSASSAAAGAFGLLPRFFVVSCSNGVSGTARYRARATTRPDRCAGPGRGRRTTPSAPSTSTCRKRHSSTSADASRRRGGPTGRPSRIDPRACSWRRCRRSCATGDGLRLAEGGGEAECPAAVRDDDRRTRHPLHSCPLSSSERHAAAS